MIYILLRIGEFLFMQKDLPGKHTTWLQRHDVAATL